MASLHVTRVVDPARMLEHAVEGLFPLAPARAERPWPTLDVWVVLRQGGLRDDLIRLAAARGVPGWFDAPICLFNELGARWLPEQVAPPLNDAEREALLSVLLEEHASALFGGARGLEAWVPIVDRFIGEVIAEGIAPADLTAALHHTADDASARSRADALGAVYAAWEHRLSQLGRVDGRDTKVRLARVIADDPDGFAARLGGRREIRLVGLADLRGGWTPLLRALAASPALDAVRILTSVTLDVADAVVTVPPDAVASFASALFTAERPRAGAAVALLEAPDAAREIEHVAKSVRALIDQGAAPRDIAVIARTARPTVDAVATTLRRLGVPVTARRRTALGHTAPGRAIAAILRAADESWSRHSIAELAEHPLLRTGLDAAVVNHVGYANALTSLDGWGDDFARLLARCEARERGEDDGEERRAALPPIERVRATHEAWALLVPRLAPLTEKRDLGAWCAWVVATLEDGDWGIGERLADPCADAEVWRADLRARDAIADLARTWRRATTDFEVRSTPLDAAAFADRFALMLAQDLITPAETDFGVVVAEALAAGWRSFAHVFVVGLSSGEFPRRPSQGLHFDPVERRALAAAGLALDPVDAWRDRERELFRVLCAAARETLTLSWPAMDADGREVARSAYADEAVAVLARQAGVAAESDAERGLMLRERLVVVPTHEQLVPGFPVVPLRGALDMVDRAHELAMREYLRAETAGPWNGAIGDAALVADLAERYGAGYEWSATQLEEAAKCRWQWFASRQLRLEERADADDLMEPTTRGTILHDALDRFFTAARTAFGAPVYLREDHLGVATTLLSAAFDEAWAAMEQRGEWLGPAATRQVARAEMRAELETYLAFEIAWNEKSFSKSATKSRGNVRTGAVGGEFGFRDVPLRGGGVDFRLRGMVDRVDRGVDARVADAERYLAAIDYKSTKYSTPAAGKKEGWDDGIVLQVPLYAAALRALHPGDELARMEYRTIRKPEIVHQLSLAPMKGDALKDAPEAEEKLARALDAAGATIADVRRGVLPAAPTESAGCSPYCPARDICRIPGGPREVR